MKVYEEQFLKKFDFPEYKFQEKKDLVIASTGRSGSHLLGHLLFSTKKLGFPLEYLNQVNLVRWQKRFNCTSCYDDVLRNVRRCRTSVNGVFSIKLHYPHLIKMGGIHSVLNKFHNPKFIFIKRRDLIAQAVSLVIARKTGNFINPTEDEIEHNNIEYCREDITNALIATMQNQMSWELELARSGAHYETIFLEEALKDPSGAISKVASLLDIAVDENNYSFGTKKQGSSINREWRKRYIEESGKDLKIDWRDFDLDELTKFLIRVKKFGKRLLK